MVSLSDIIQHLYPTANLSPFGNVQLADEGNGPYIAKWDDSLGPQPTQAQLDAAIPAVTNNLTIAELTRELEKHYDAIAQTKRYDNRLTCALRAGYAGPFQVEGTTFAIWMDTCNAYGYQVMADCLAGRRSVPTAAQLISELPMIAW